MNEFPLDYCNLKIHELEILEKLFIDSTLLGLHRSLGYTRVSDGDYSETGSYHSDDPDVSLVIATGTMECVRYFIDRLLTPMEDENRKEVLLAKKLYSKVLIRLFSDCLITHARVHTFPKLVCSRPPLSRQSYLNIVFNQVSSTIKISGIYIYIYKLCQYIYGLELDSNLLFIVYNFLHFSYFRQVML